MGRHDLAFMFNAELGEHVSGEAHGVPVAATPHDHADKWCGCFSHAAIFGVPGKIVNAMQADIRGC